MTSERTWTDITTADEILKAIKHGFTGEAHPDTFSIAAMPVVKEKKDGQLPDEVIRKFFEDGYVVVEDFFTDEEMDPVKEAVKDLLDIVAQKLYRTGRIKNLYKEAGFYERLAKIEREFPGAEILLIKLGILPQAFKNLWTNERLLNVVEQIIGPDIAGHPVWALRPKTPKSDVLTVAWHQDACYLDNDVYNVLMPTVWIPLLDANKNNGCMEFAAKGHRTGRVAMHTCCAGETWNALLKEEEMEKTLGVNLKEDLEICPVPYKGFVLFNNMVPHRSVPNNSELVRYSVDFRFTKADVPCGFFGLGESALLRTSRDPNYKIDWGNIDGNKKMETERDHYEEHEFDTTIQGPWMAKWDLVKGNRHTVKMEKKLNALRTETNNAM